MKIQVINIANKMPSWIDEGCCEYLKRINHGPYSCDLVEIKTAKNPHKTAQENMQIEAVKLQQAIIPGNYLIAFDEHGERFDSIKFAKFLDKKSATFPGISCIIGGADGIDQNLLKAANSQISLSSMVFPHGLVRIIVLEQIYRAISILENHPYHRQ